MYKQMLSQQWLFDRCLEVGYVLSPLVTGVFLAAILAAIPAILLYLLLKKGFTKKKPLVISIVIVSFIILFPIFLFLEVSIGFSLCNDGMFWASISPAHQLHALLKEQKKKTGTYPHNQAQLTNLAPDLMKDINSNAETIYIYNPVANTYTWFVRPSRYYVAIFDTKKDYALYSIPHLFNPHHWDIMGSFPPSYSGPWNNIPQ